MSDKSRKTVRARDLDTELSRRALAELLATEAAALPPVQQFRKRVLNDKLLASTEIPSWIERQHKADDTAEARRRAKASETADEIQYGRNLVRPVWPGGVLDALRTISEQLARGYSWERRAATNFILSGSKPRLPR